jgi:1,2-diacylglycerol-3-alpha-glucose alpha-1,2-galactosyltransferase
VKKITINVLYDTSSTGHGVSTAFTEMVRGLRARSDTDVRVNSWRRADIIHGHSPGPVTALHMLLGRGRKVFSAHQVYGSLEGSVIFGSFIEGLFFWYVKHAIYNRCRVVIAVSGMSAHILRTRMQVTRPRIVNIYNTVDMASLKVTPAKRQAARRKFHLKQKDFVVVGNGQLQPRKGIATFVEMARALPELKFVWVGGLPFKAIAADLDEIKALQKTSPDNLIWAGMVSLDEARQYMAAADVFCLPSLQENHPMAVLEAAGAGLPIVLRDIPEYDDTFRDDAVLVDEAGFAPAVDRLARDAAYRRQTIAGSRRIAKRFDNATGAQQLMRLYREILR